MDTSNVEYINKLINDPTTPLINRAFNEKRAPGSTFKMISAVTALETGIVDKNFQVYDEVLFEDASFPPASCWNLSGHGYVDLVKAVEVSCNYYFFRTIYMLGNAKDGNKYNSIEHLNKYMAEFGLNEKSGVEIGEADSIMSSPEYKKIKYPDDFDWADGDTIRTAIGQYLNNYTPAVLAKYIATVANKGDRYKLHFLDRIESSNGVMTEKVEPVVENYVDIQDSTWDTIYEGMLQVTVGNNGTARRIFSDFPIEIGGKTGTAQESAIRKDHTSFGGFAPYDNPEIAIYVAIPFGDTKGTPAAASEVAREIIGKYMGLDSKVEYPVQTNSLA